MFNIQDQVIICQNDRKIVPATGASLIEIRISLQDHIRRNHPHLNQPFGWFDSLLRSLVPIRSAISLVSDPERPHPSPIVEGVDVISGFKCGYDSFCRYYYYYYYISITLAFRTQSYGELSSALIQFLCLLYLTLCLRLRQSLKYFFSVSSHSSLLVFST